MKYVEEHYWNSGSVDSQVIARMRGEPFRCVCECTFETFEELQQHLHYWKPVHLNRIYRSGVLVEQNDSTLLGKYRLGRCAGHPQDA